MKKEIIIALTLIALNVVGQTHFVGIKGSTNWTNITSNDSYNTSYRNGFSGGITYEYLLKTHFSLGADLIYNKQGFIENIDLMDEQGTVLDFDKIYNNYDYLSIPIKAGYNIGNRLYYFANIGLIPSLLVNAKTVYNMDDSDGKVLDSFVRELPENVSKFDLAGLIEIGGGFKFKNRYWLYSSLGYQKSFTTITNSYSYSNRKIRNNGIYFSIGIKYSIARREIK